MIHNRNRRRAAALMTVLVLISMIAISAVWCAKQQLLLVRQQLREANANQAMWLAEAALERALIRLNSDPAYTGETWQVELSQPATTKTTGTVEIRVAAASMDQSERQVTIAARFPTDPVFGSLHVLHYPLAALKKE